MKASVQGIWSLALSAAIWLLAPGARADRQITVELETDGAPPPSHLCVISERIVDADAPGAHRLPAKGGRLEFEAPHTGQRLEIEPATAPPKLDPDGSCKSSAAPSQAAPEPAQTPAATEHEPSCEDPADEPQTDTYSAWRDCNHNDPCEASFKALPHENARCAINKSPGIGARLGIVVLRIRGRRIDDVELVGRTATIDVSDMASNKAQSMTVAVIGAHYLPASGATRPNGAGRELLSLPLARKCRRVPMPALPDPYRASLVKLTAGNNHACLRSANPREIELPFLAPGQRVTATLSDLEYIAQPTSDRGAALVFAPTRVRFSWTRHCLVPEPLCPKAELPQVNAYCEQLKSPDRSVCSYECQSRPAHTPIELPTPVRFELQMPDVTEKGAPSSVSYGRWSDALRYIGQPFDSFVPASERWLKLDWPHNLHARSIRTRDAITQVELSDATGTVYAIALCAARINVPGLRCHDSFRYQYVGDRRFRTHHLRLSDYTHTLHFVDPDDDIIKRATLAIELGVGSAALVGASDFRQPLVGELAAMLVMRAAPQLDWEIVRINATYADHPFLSRLEFQNGSLAHEDLRVTIPYAHVGVGTALSISFSDDFYAGAGAGGALGTKLRQRDNDRARVAPELTGRIFAGFRVTRTFAFEAAAQGIFFAKWLRAEQTQQGLQRLQDRRLQLLYMTLSVRFDDLI